MSRHRSARREQKFVVRSVRIVPLVVLVTLVAFAGIVLAAHSFGTGSASAAGRTPPRLGVPPGGTPTRIKMAGIPAIHPHMNLVNNGTAPTFTQADVLQYVATHPLGQTVRGSAAPTVVSVQFLTAQQVSAQLRGEDTGDPPGIPLCLVFVNGTFQTGGDDAGYAPITYHVGYLVFDAQTGNLIMTNV